MVSRLPTTKNYQQSNDEGREGIQFEREKKKTFYSPASLNHPSCLHPEFPNPGSYSRSSKAKEGEWAT